MQSSLQRKEKNSGAPFTASIDSALAKSVGEEGELEASVSLTATTIPTAMATRNNELMIACIGANGNANASRGFIGR